MLSRIPVNSQKSIASGLLSVAVFTALFGVLSFMAFGESTKEECSGLLVWRTCTKNEVALGERLPWLVLTIALGVVALLSVLLALRLFTMRGNSNRYLAVLTGVETISIQRIAEITNSRPAKVRDDIQGMIDSDMITDFYIDYSTDQVVSRKYIPKSSYKTVVACSGCGGTNELIVGITKTCSFCGQPLQLGTR
jgi:hypothetical protein